ncbi:MAG: hypothetical protein J5I94_29315 [Phaeodactylibacter sp.]|nr:hypothetical protein [Phaeodactylibacter sp.]
MLLIRLSVYICLSGGLLSAFQVNDVHYSKQQKAPFFTLGLKEGPGVSFNPPASRKPPDAGEYGVDIAEARKTVPLRPDEVAAGLYPGQVKAIGLFMAGNGLWASRENS